MEALAFEQRARQARVERQPRHHPAATGDAPVGIESLEFLQQAVAVAERACVRRVDEREILRLPQTVRRQAQQQGGEIGAQNFRLGEGLARLEVRLRI